MGRDKALLPYGQQRLIDHMLALLDTTGLSPLCVSGDLKDIAACTPDAYPRSGPISGICTIVSRAATSRLDGWLFVPVDMPLLQPPLLQKLLTAKSHAADATRYEESPFPLLLWNTPHTIQRAAYTADALVNGAQFSVRQFLDPLSTTHLVLKTAEQAQLTNINTPEDWHALQTAMQF
jgi:molybdopterin-guanine dinucleotide biosynthesis protein A